MYSFNGIFGAKSSSATPPLTKLLTLNQETPSDTPHNFEIAFEGLENYQMVVDDANIVDPELTTEMSPKRIKMPVPSKHPLLCMESAAPAIPQDANVILKKLQPNGSMHSLIILNPLGRYEPILHELAAAKRGDEIKIIIAPLCSMCADSTAIASAIMSSQAKIYTSATDLYGYGDLMIWLSGDFLYGSKRGIINVTPDVRLLFGNSAELQNQFEQIKNQTSIFNELILRHQLFTEEELSNFNDNRPIVLSGDDLIKRIEVANEYKKANPKPWFGLDDDKE